MANTARAFRAAFIHASTNHVFDGKNSQPYTEEDHIGPLNVYGHTILMREKQIQAVDGAYLILRTSRVYSLPGKGFINKMLGCSHKNTTLKIVSAHFSNSTQARALAYTASSVLVENRNGLLEKFREKRGMHHVAGSGQTSRYKWTKEILTNDHWRTERLFQTIEPVSSDEFPTPVTRTVFRRWIVLDLKRHSTSYCLTRNSRCRRPAGIIGRSGLCNEQDEQFRFRNARSIKIPSMG